MTSRSRIVLIIVVAAIALGAVVIWRSQSPTPPQQTPPLVTAGTPIKIRYGISPFQDTAMPVVAQDLGLYKRAGLDVELRTVAWEDVIPSLASAGQTIDVGIGSINLLLPRADNINVKGGGDVVFYYPLYVFKGASLVARKDLPLKTFADLLKEASGDRKRALMAQARQLRGLRIGVPKGTPYEQMLYAILNEAGMNPDRDIQRRDVKLADALPALLRGDLDVIGAGVTQRTEAARQGHKAIIDMEGMGFGEIIGIVTTERFAKAHPEELRKLIQVWFESVDLLLSDVPRHSQGVLRYLAENASTKYSLDEYQSSLALQEFPRNIAEARTLMLSPQGRFYWKRTWDVVNSYLIASAGQKDPIPYQYFRGDEVNVAP